MIVRVKAPALLLMGIVILALLAPTGCKKKQDDNSTVAAASSGDPNEAPVLKNLLVDFGRWDSSTNLAGAFNFASNSMLKPFTGHGDSYGFPTPATTYGFNYRGLSVGKNVYAPFDGVVSNVAFQPESEPDDYEIHLRPNKDSKWLMNVDHVLNPKVSIGQSVKAGDVIAETREYILEIDISDFSTSSTLSYCFWDFFDPALLSEYRQKVVDLMKDWEAFKGDAAIYDESKAGCLVTEPR